VTSSGVGAASVVYTKPGKSLTVLEFKMSNFQAWKVMEKCFGPLKVKDSWKMGCNSAGILP